MLCLPASLDALLVLLAPCFTRPTFRTFRALVVGQISQTGLRTVTGMLVGARLAGVWHHARAHRFFSHARWLPDELGLLLSDAIVARLTEPGAALVLPVDDTLLQRLGRKVHATFWHHDATANSNRSAVAWGNNWVVVGIDVKLPFLARTVCLPILFRLWQPKRKHIPKGKPDPERPSKPELAREMVDLIAARHPDRKLDVVGDSAYGSGAWRGLPPQMTLTVRPRKDAALTLLIEPMRGVPSFLRLAAPLLMAMLLLALPMVLLAPFRGGSRCRGDYGGSRCWGAATTATAPSSAGAVTAI